MARCSHTGCSEEARYRPVFLLGFIGSGVSYRVGELIEVCPSHRAALHRCFTSAATQQRLKRRIRERTGAAIDSERAQLFFVPIN